MPNIYEFCSLLQCYHGKWLVSWYYSIKIQLNFYTPLLFPKYVGIMLTSLAIFNACHTFFSTIQLLNVQYLWLYTTKVPGNLSFVKVTCVCSAKNQWGKFLTSQVFKHFDEYLQCIKEHTKGKILWGTHLLANYPISQTFPIELLYYNETSN